MAEDPTALAAAQSVTHGDARRVLATPEACSFADFGTVDGGAVSGDAGPEVRDDVCGVRIEQWCQVAGADEEQGLAGW